MYCKLVSCADFKAILMPFREDVWNRYSSLKKMDEGDFMLYYKEEFYVELSR